MNITKTYLFVLKISYVLNNGGNHANPTGQTINSHNSVPLARHKRAVMAIITGASIILPLIHSVKDLFMPEKQTPNFEKLIEKIETIRRTTEESKSEFVHYWLPIIIIIILINLILIPWFMRDSNNTPEYHLHKSRYRTSYATRRSSRSKRSNRTSKKRSLKRSRKTKTKNHSIKLIP